SVADNRGPVLNAEAECLEERQPHFALNLERMRAFLLPANPPPGFVVQLSLVQCDVKERGVMRSATLAEEVPDRLTRGDGRRAAVPAQARFEWHAERVVDRGTEVLRTHWPVLHVSPDPVRRAIGRASANARAGQNRGEAIRPVEPAGLSLGVDLRGT